MLASAHEGAEPRALGLIPEQRRETFTDCLKVGDLAGSTGLPRIPISMSQALKVPIREGVAWKASSKAYFHWLRLTHHRSPYDPHDIGRVLKEVSTSISRLSITVRKCQPQHLG